ncbi:Thymidine phosphorylase [Pseudohaliea rubra DSM 19751]|uniref:Thymidine phosphorylase n=2 Tax=Pseudohaliea TaxID=1341120 RepID=A0A095VRN6_9GAMM|nr:Thymidine phosphorylase [Pseudohaliea rubra DSM 19751]
MLQQERLTTYLRDAVGAAEPLLTIIRQRTAEDGPAQLAAADAATIEWISLAFDCWSHDYPVEAPLRDTLHRLLPLAIAVALAEHSFFTPGAHPLHKLLDRLQHSAVGWQTRLDRAGQMLEQRVRRAVERALAWFEDPGTDFSAITQELEAAAHRDEERAARMVHRLEETEQAAVRTRHARREAAGIINRGLASCELPMAIGEFLKGPWYDSLQLVALRHGTSSQEWREISRITDQLMRSVQPAVGGGDQGGSTLRRLSGELRHWLLSLEHDSAATDDAIGLVEYVHLRMTHGQDLGLTHIRPLAVPGEQDGSGGEDGAAASLETGQWYLLQDEHGELRARLSLQLEEGRHLLFTNAVGLKALDLDRASFIERLRSASARHLPAEDSFSLSLSHAAGIDDHHKLRALIEPGYRPPEPEQPPELELPPEAEQPAAAEQPHEPAQQPVFEHPTEPECPPEAEHRITPDPEPPTEAAPTPDPFGDREAPAKNTTETANADPPEPATTSETRPPPTDTLPEFAPPPAPARPWAEAEAEAEAGAEAEVESNLPSLELELVGDEPGQEYQATAPARERRSSAPAPVPAPAPQPATSERPRRTPPGPEMDVPMGAWLGFHDGETPIMAKLAVYDPRRDNYIFVNRRGIALRELSRGELLALIDDGLVDILETRCYFRDEVQRAREHRDD